MCPGGGVHDGSKPLPDDRPQSIWTFPHFHLSRCQKKIQRGQQGRYWHWPMSERDTDTSRVSTDTTDSINNDSLVCVCVDRMWSSRTIHSLRRCFILSSWSLVRKCVVMLVWTSVCPAARSRLCLCVHVQVSGTSQVWDRWRRLTRSEEKSSTSCRSDQWLTANSSRLYLRMWVMSPPVCGSVRLFMSVSICVCLMSADAWLFPLIQGNKETGLERVIDTVALFKCVAIFFFLFSLSFNHSTPTFDPLNTQH